MAIIRMADARKLSVKERQEKLHEISLALLKGQVTAHKATAKTKELKRARARLLTLAQHEEAKKA
ncbi:hypothetical protein EXS73_03465 [Candidatus Pacearchaeota archaeon]|nr:hypothetical protein [Candidatus Pacearchaeota archaeon]